MARYLEIILEKRRSGVLPGCWMRKLPGPVRLSGALCHKAEMCFMPSMPAMRYSPSFLFWEKWGIHFTQVTPIFCGLGSRDFGVPIGNDRAIRGWVNGHSLLHQPVEELAAAA